MMRSDPHLEPTARVLITGKVSMERQPDDTVRLGEWLVRRNLISRSELFDALDHCYRRRCRIGDALVALGLLARARVESEARFFCAALMPDGQLRGVAPPPVPPDALMAPSDTEEIPIHVYPQLDPAEEETERLTLSAGRRSRARRPARPPPRA
jgi:hypothetical protein